MNKGKTIELNGVTYMVEHIYGKGDCLVPVKKTPVIGEVWLGIKGGVYLIVGDDPLEVEALELRVNKLYELPSSAMYAAKNIKEAIQLGGIL